MSTAPEHETDAALCIPLCPGQGAQAVGMGRELARREPAAAELFRQADAILGFDLSEVCFDGPEATLNRTDVAQAAIYTCSVASYRAAEAHGRLQPDQLAAAAGLSLGEFTALHLAGAFDFEAGLKLVHLRGQAMQAAAEGTASGMVALVGADEAQATELCDRARGDDVLVPANFNAPGQVVVSGSAAACERALEVATEMGLRATALRVAGAFHSPIMQPAAERLAQAMGRMPWQTPRIPVVSNVTALPHESDPDSIRRRLVEQLTRPVRWAQSMQWLLDNPPRGCRRLIELEPGKVLAGLMKRINRRTPVEPVSALLPQTA